MMMLLIVTAERGHLLSHPPAVNGGERTCADSDNETTDDDDDLLAVLSCGGRRLHRWFKNGESTLFLRLATMRCVFAGAVTLMPRLRLYLASCLLCS